MSNIIVQRSNMTQTDSKGKVLRQPRDNSAGQAVNFRWWDVDEKQMAAAINATTQFIQRHQGSRMEQLTVSTRLYGSSSVYNIMGAAFTRASSVNSNPMTQRISYNICESVIDTLESKMAKNKIIPTYITNGGDWDIQKKAKQLTKFTQGLFYKENVHQKSIHAWKDGAIWGDGFVKVLEKEDKVCIERAYSHELLVDLLESVTGHPQQLHQVKFVDRDIAYALWPELEESISLVAPATFQEIGGQGTAVDIIAVIESWHLKSGGGSKDGVRVITIGDGVLVDSYDRDYFPFPHLRYCKRPFGWYGQGVCERLQTIQGEINRSMILKQRSLWMQGSFKILLENGSKVVSQHLNNDVGALVHYTGTPPQYVAPPATNPELQAWIDSLMTYGYNQEGISRMQTTGEAPIGVDSGKAMRTLVQISDDRFAFMSQELEDFTLEIGRQAVNIAKDIYKRKGKYEVIFPSTQFIETIDWGSIKLDESDYVLKAFPTSSLSDDLTGRLAEIQEMTQAGFMSPKTSQRLLDMPDLEIYEALSNAPEDRLHQIFEKMLEEGEATRFEAGFHDAVLARPLALQFINYGEFMNAPKENIQLIRDFLDQMNAEAGPMPGIVPQPMPTANPMPTPQSNLIPNGANAA